MFRPQVEAVGVAVKLGVGVLLVTVKLAVLVQLPPAETVTEYVPAAMFTRSSVVAPFDQMNVYVFEGVIVMSILPLGVVQEVTGLVLPAILIAGLLFVTVTVVVAVQPLEVAVTVTE
ncbi:MAG: hypothetical protein IPJ40_16520 [Saprospirales bacterium]|nr:hypothetical protein [Saprospirales bacterium]